MSRFNGSITITNNAGDQNLVTVPIDHNTWSAVSAAVQGAITTGAAAAAAAAANWTGAQNAFNT